MSRRIKELNFLFALTESKNAFERSVSLSNFEIVGESKEAEYFFASDASAVIEHTNRVIYLEDNDVAAVQDGCEYILSHLYIKLK